MTSSGDNGDCVNCARPASGRSALCYRCQKYRQRHGRLPTQPPRSYGDQWETLKAAMRAWLEIDSDAAFANYSRGQKSRAEARVARAAERWVAKHRRNVGSKTMSDK